MRFKDLPDWPPRRIDAIEDHIDSVPRKVLGKFFA
jgi:IS30 family transposase